MIPGFSVSATAIGIHPRTPERDLFCRPLKAIAEATYTLTALDADSDTTALTFTRFWLRFGPKIR